MWGLWKVNCGIQPGEWNQHLKQHWASGGISTSSPSSTLWLELNTLDLAVDTRIEHREFFEKPLHFDLTLWKGNFSLQKRVWTFPVLSSLSFLCFLTPPVNSVNVIEVTGSRYSREPKLWWRRMFLSVWQNCNTKRVGRTFIFLPLSCHYWPLT